MNSSKVIIVNKNYPPNPGITGESAAELAKFLIDHNVEVEILSTDTSYSNNYSTIIGHGKTDRIKSFYNGKNKLIRLFFSFYNSYRLINTAKAKSDNSDIIIVMTDPPFLSYWASKLLKKNKWFLWSMDLYPDAFVASHLASPNNPFYKYLYKTTYTNSPNYLIALGKMQSKYIKHRYQNSINSTILPCGIHDLTESASKPIWKNDEKIYLGYCGNIGAAHSLNFVKEIIANSANGKYKFILSVYGSNANELKRYASQFNHVVLTDNVKKENLTYIDIHVVTLKKEWEHVCVPSKAVSAICSGSTIMFCGSETTDTWNLLGNAGWLIAEDNTKIMIPKLLKKINNEKIQCKKLRAINLKNELINMKTKSFANILNKIRR